MHASQKHILVLLRIINALDSPITSLVNAAHQLLLVPIAKRSNRNRVWSDNAVLMATVAILEFACKKVEMSHVPETINVETSPLSMRDRTIVRTESALSNQIPFELVTSVRLMQIVSVELCVPIENALALSRVSRALDLNLSIANLERTVLVPLESVLLNWVKEIFAVTSSTANADWDCFVLRTTTLAFRISRRLQEQIALQEDSNALTEAFVSMENAWLPVPAI